MAERRMLWKEVSQSRKVNSLSDKAAILWTWAIPWFDRDGYLEAEPDYLKFNVVPRRENIKIADIQSLVDEIVGIGLWESFQTTDGIRVVREPKFAEKQKGLKYDREGKSKFNDLDSLIPDHSRTTPGPLPNNSPLKERKGKEVKGKERNIYPPEFEDFWKIYPNHASGKAEAFKSWEKVNPDKALLKIILESVREHKLKSRDWKDGFIPHATTWLNQKRWTAEFTADTEVKPKKKYGAPDDWRPEDA